MNWRFFILIGLLLPLPGCAYRFGYMDRSLPGGYERIAIPVFANKTMEVGIETYFTNSLIRQFERSKAARVTHESLAPLTLVGTIEQIEFRANTQADSDDIKNLPKGAVLTTEYRIIISATLELRRNSDRRVIWEGHFRDEKVYSAPQVSMPVVNSVNPLYNHSSRHQNIALLAQDMMEEAHDRMTENF